MAAGTAGTAKWVVLSVGDGLRGRLWAIDAETGKTTWVVDTRSGGQIANLSVTPDSSGILATVYADAEEMTVLTRYSARDGSVV